MYSLVLPFDTEDPQFARGVEVGVVWARLARDDRPFRATVHMSNIEMMMRMAEVWHCTAQGEELSDEWVTITFTDLEPVRRVELPAEGL